MQSCSASTAGKQCIECKKRRLALRQYSPEHRSCHCDSHDSCCSVGTKLFLQSVKSQTRSTKWRNRRRPRSRRGTTRTAETVRMKGPWSRCSQRSAIVLSIRQNEGMPACLIQEQRLAGPLLRLTAPGPSLLLLSQLAISHGPLLNHCSSQSVSFAMAVGYKSPAMGNCGEQNCS